MCVLESARGYESVTVLTEQTVVNSGSVYKLSACVCVYVCVGVCGYMCKTTEVMTTAHRFRGPEVI